MNAFAIPVVHSVEHLEASGARALLDELQQDTAFLADPTVREQGLARVRSLIEAYPVEPKLPAEVTASLQARWPGEPLRFRSSSNAKDLPSFNGAGLYTSVGLDSDEVPKKVAGAIRTVWRPLEPTRVRRARLLQRRSDVGGHGGAGAPGFSLRARQWGGHQP